MNTDTPRKLPAELPDEANAYIGRVLDDRYRIEEVLGEGGMGAVFVAEHLKLHKRVAVKVIREEFAGDGEVAARFAREAMASAQLDHPHVASAMDYGSLDEGGAFLVMQLARGRALSQLVDDEGRQSWSYVCEVGAQVADALAAAHAIGIVHRDLKPDNVILEQRSDGRPLAKVLDFGIARVAIEGVAAPENAAPGRALTRVGTVMGTPGYMAPEQAMGEEVDQRADLYALGVLLWEMLAGKPLYDVRDLTMIVSRQLTQPPLLASVVAEDPSVPAELDHMIAALLKPTPDDRPDSASAVRDTLRELAFMRQSLSRSGERPLPVEDASPDPATANTMLAGVTGPQPATATTVTAFGDRLRNLPPRQLALAGGAVAALLLIAILAVLIGDTPDIGTKAGAPPVVEDRFSIGDLIPTPPTVPSDVQERIDAMVSGERRRERRDAAEWLVTHEPADEVPDWAVAAAQLETARGCSDRRDALAAIRDGDHTEALPVVMRYHESPRRGCGFLNMNDCYDCIRSELAETVAALED